MAVSFLARFASGDVVDPESFVIKFNRLERYLNGKIRIADVSYTEENKALQRWVKEEHVYKPEFYGSPDPRIVATSGTVHHRFFPVGRLQRSVHHGISHMQQFHYDRTDDPTMSAINIHNRGWWQRQRLWPHRDDAHHASWQTIRGMAVTIFNDGGPDGEDDRDVIVTGSCTAWEVGGFDPTDTQPDGDKDMEALVLTGAERAYGPEKIECARLGLWVDGVLEATTVRRIFASRGERWVHKNFMWTHVFVAGPGYHNVEFKLKVLKRFKSHTDPPDRWKRIVVDSRSVVVDMQNFREPDSGGWPE